MRTGRVRMLKLARPNLFASAYVMVSLKRIAPELARNLGTPRGRRSLYDFAVVSLAVWLLGGLMVLVLWGPSAENQTDGRLAADQRDTSAQQLPLLRRRASQRRGELSTGNCGTEQCSHGALRCIGRR